jgi:hypothetical protein
MLIFFVVAVTATATATAAATTTTAITTTITTTATTIAARKSVSSLLCYAYRTFLNITISTNNCTKKQTHHPIQFMTSIKVLHVSAPENHPQNTVKFMLVKLVHSRILMF